MGQSQKWREESASIIKSSLENLKHQIRHERKKGRLYCYTSIHGRCSLCCLFCEEACLTPKCWHEATLLSCTGRVGAVEKLCQKL